MSKKSKIIWYGIFAEICFIGFAVLYICYLKGWYTNFNEIILSGLAGIILSVKAMLVNIIE